MQDQTQSIPEPRSEQEPTVDKKKPPQRNATQHTRTVLLAGVLKNW